jgi:hypothetical protein
MDTIYFEFATQLLNICCMKVILQRLRWINDVEDDSRKLGVKRWRTKALDRVEWASIVRENKAKLKGP